ncbi:MAG: adenylate/guanylate cyclase domain-containing protein [Actinomycetota bacterium]
MKTCRSCGAPVAENARFCPSCGASQASIEEERRIITAVFADIVGFTALAERQDPEEVKHLVDRAFVQLTEDIRTFGGVVDKIVGDQVVALFGAPVAHSDDAERAVRAGLRMQASIDRLGGDGGPPVHIRVGINTGEVLVGSTSTGGDYTAMGDVMNSASRLQELAQPGQVLVGDTTRQATGDAVRYQSAGSLPARGREDPLEAWVAVEVTQPPGARRRTAELFVGRQRELAFLESQAMMAMDLQTAQLAVVVGEAGMGKHRLIQETSARLAERTELLVLQGRCVAYGEANVWWPIGELVRELYGLAVDLNRSEAEARLRVALAERFGTDEPEVTRWLTALLHMLGYDTPLRGGEKNRNRSEVALAFRQILEQELRRRAVVIHLTDMHWASDALWIVLDHVLGELAKTPLFIMVSTQTFDDEAMLSRRHGTSILPLGPLNAGAARQLVTEVGPDLSLELAEELVARSGGNPYFLEELAGYVGNGGTVDDNGERTVSGPGHDLGDLPDTLRGIVAARLDRLEPAQRALIEDASIFGRSGTLIGLQTLAREARGVKSIDDALAALVSLDLLAINGSRYEFISELVRDVAYGTLTKTVRAQRHAGIADYLSADQTDRIRNSIVVAIAENYRASAQLASEVSYIPGLDPAEVRRRALYWLGQAGDRALEVGEPTRAERWYEYGLDLSTEREDQARFLFGRAKARCEVRDIPGARADLDRLEPLLEHDPATAAQALLIRGDVNRKAGELDRAASELREAADRLAALEIPDGQALALRLLGITEMERADDQLATQALTSSRMVAARAGDRRSEAWALQSLAWHAFVRGEVHTADELVIQAVDIFAELGDRNGLAWAQGVQAWIAFHIGEWETAQELLTLVLPEARRRGDPAVVAIMLNLAASLSLWSGRAREAQSLAGQAQVSAAKAEDDAALVQALALSGRALVSLGRISEGTELLEEAFNTAERSGDRDARRIAVIANCASAARIGEPERAIRWAARYEGSHEDPSNVGEADLMVSMTLALLQRGAVAEAATQLSWTDGSKSERRGQFEQSMAALLAAVEGRYDAVERSVQTVIAGHSTYLDRVLALVARAAARHATDDLPARDRALAAAWAELDGTDDQTSRLVLALFGALVGRGDPLAAEQAMRARGLDPAGWRTAWSAALGVVGSTPG